MPVYEMRPPFGLNYGRCDDCGAGGSDPSFPSEMIPLNEFYNEVMDETEHLCNECFEEAMGGSESDSSDAPRSGDERSHREEYSFETDFPEQPAPRMLLPVLENRAQRLVSIEQEVASGGSFLAHALYEAGFTTVDEMVGYHRSSNLGGFCAVEQDSSVDGEIVYGRLRLDTAPVARQLESALSLVRDAIKAGECSLDMRCGLHVHVDIKGYGMGHVENLYHLWNHLEDVIYRLGSANWSDHRTNIARSNYARTVQKGMTSRRQLGQWFNDTRECGLNLSNYLQARGNCHCGAFTFGSWEECTCDLPKSTAEFRVFNGTANLRKIHAYTALSLAMVEYAQTGDEDFAALPAQTFNSSIVEPERVNALELIFERLPLTGDEKDSLLYCVQHSSLREHLVWLDVPSTESEVV